MKRVISICFLICLLSSGMVIGVYGFKMRDMTVSHKEVRYRKETITKSTKGRNAIIGGSIGAIAGGGTAAALGGIGVVACGTGVGAPAGVPLIIGATLVGGGTGAVIGAASGESNTETRLIKYYVTVQKPKYTDTECYIVIGIGFGIYLFSVVLLFFK